MACGPLFSRKAANRLSCFSRQVVLSRPTIRLAYSALSSSRRTTAATARKLAMRDEKHESHFARGDRLYDGQFAGVDEGARTGSHRTRRGVVRMNRDTLITVLLVIAGVVLAFVLFGAGAFWKGRTSPKRQIECVSWPVVTIGLFVQQPILLHLFRYLVDQAIRDFLCRLRIERIADTSPYKATILL